MCLIIQFNLIHLRVKQEPDVLILLKGKVSDGSQVLYGRGGVVLQFRFYAMKRWGTSGKMELIIRKDS